MSEGETGGRDKRREDVRIREGRGRERPREEVQE